MSMGPVGLPVAAIDTHPRRHRNILRLRGVSQERLNRREVQLFLAGQALSASAQIRISRSNHTAGNALRPYRSRRGNRSQ